MKVVVPFDPELVRIGEVVASANASSGGWLSTVASLLQGAQALSFAAILALVFFAGAPPLYITAEQVAQWAKYFVYGGLAAGILAAVVKSSIQQSPEGGSGLNGFSLEITPEHLVYRERNSVLLCSWEDLTKVESDGKFLYVFNVNGRVIVVPTAAFPDRRSFEDFHAALASHIAGT